MAAIIFLVLFVLMWVVLIVPRQREMRRHQALMSQLEVGDEVMMGSGVYGTIRALDGDYVRLEVAEGVVLKIARRAVAAKVPEPEPEAEADAQESGTTPEAQHTPDDGHDADRRDD